MKVGILGDGQLGRMLAIAGESLGVKCRFFCGPDPVSITGLGEEVHGDLSDLDALKKFSEGLDVVTYETENIPLKPVQFLLDQGVKVFPGIKSLETCQDRLFEKTLFNKLKIPTTKFVAIDSQDDISKAEQTLGIPFVLKSRRFGYDGKNQRIIRTKDDLNTLDTPESFYPALAEEFVEFDCEISRICVRSADGKIKFYPMVQNIHRDGILLWSMSPRPELIKQFDSLSELCIKLIADELGHCGVMAVEFFIRGEYLIANEIAPRVHNTGHWSIEACKTSQFENHLRAILNLPLGDTKAHKYWVMRNILGWRPDEMGLERIPNTYFHWYEKAIKPKRKVGHVTTTANDYETLKKYKAQLAELMMKGPS